MLACEPSSNPPLKQIRGLSALPRPGSRKKQLAGSIKKFTPLQTPSTSAEPYTQHSQPATAPAEQLLAPLPSDVAQQAAGQTADDACLPAPTCPATAAQGSPKQRPEVHGLRLPERPLRLPSGRRISAKSSAVGSSCGPSGEAQVLCSTGKEQAREQPASSSPAAQPVSCGLLGSAQLQHSSQAQRDSSDDFYISVSGETLARSPENGPRSPATSAPAWQPIVDRDGDMQTVAVRMPGGVKMHREVADPNELQATLDDLCSLSQAAWNHAQPSGGLPGQTQSSPAHSMGAPAEPIIQGAGRAGSSLTTPGVAVPAPSSPSKATVRQEQGSCGQSSPGSSPRGLTRELSATSPAQEDSQAHVAAADADAALPGSRASGSCGSSVQPSPATTVPAPAEEEVHPEAEGLTTQPPAPERQPVSGSVAPRADGIEVASRPQRPPALSELVAGVEALHEEFSQVADSTSALVASLRSDHSSTGALAAAAAAASERHASSAVKQGPALDQQASAEVVSPGRKKRRLVRAGSMNPSHKAACSENTGSSPARLQQPAHQKGRVPAAGHQLAAGGAQQPEGGKGAQAPIDPCTAVAASIRNISTLFLPRSQIKALWTANDAFSSRSKQSLFQDCIVRMDEPWRYPSGCRPVLFQVHASHGRNEDPDKRLCLRMPNNNLQWVPIGRLSDDSVDGLMSFELIKYQLRTILSQGNQDVLTAAMVAGVQQRLIAAFMWCQADRGANFGKTANQDALLEKMLSQPSDASLRAVDYTPLNLKALEQAAQRAAGLSSQPGASIGRHDEPAQTCPHLPEPSSSNVELPVPTIPMCQPARAEQTLSMRPAAVPSAPASGPPAAAGPGPQQPPPAKDVIMAEMLLPAESRMPPTGLPTLDDPHAAPAKGQSQKPPCSPPVPAAGAAGVPHSPPAAAASPAQAAPAPAAAVAAQALSRAEQEECDALELAAFADQIQPESATAAPPAASPGACPTLPSSMTEPVTPEQPYSPTHPAQAADGGDQEHPPGTGGQEAQAWHQAAKPAVVPAEQGAGVQGEASLPASTAAAAPHSVPVPTTAATPQHALASAAAVSTPVPAQPQQGYSNWTGYYDHAAAYSQAQQAWHAQAQAYAQQECYQYQGWWYNAWNQPVGQLAPFPTQQTGYAYHHAAQPHPWQQTSQPAPATPAPPMPPQTPYPGSTNESAAGIAVAPSSPQAGTPTAEANQLKALVPYEGSPAAEAGQAASPARHQSPDLQQRGNSNAASAPDDTMSPDVMAEPEAALVAEVPDASDSPALPFGPEPDPDKRLTAAEMRMEQLIDPGRQQQDTAAQELRQQQLAKLQKVKDRLKPDAAGRKGLKPGLAETGSKARKLNGTIDFALKPDSPLVRKANEATVGDDTTEATDPLEEQDDSPPPVLPFTRADSPSPIELASSLLPSPLHNRPKTTRWGRTERTPDHVPPPAPAAPAEQAPQPSPPAPTAEQVQPDPPAAPALPDVPPAPPTEPAAPPAAPASSTARKSSGPAATSGHRSQSSAARAATPPKSVSRAAPGRDRHSGHTSSTQHPRAREPRRSRSPPRRRDGTRARRSRSRERGRRVGDRRSGPRRRSWSGSRSRSRSRSSSAAPRRSSRSRVPHTSGRDKRRPSPRSSRPHGRSDRRSRSRPRSPPRRPGKRSRSPSPAGLGKRPASGKPTPASNKPTAPPPAEQQQALHSAPPRGWQPPADATEAEDGAMQPGTPGQHPASAVPPSNLPPAAPHPAVAAPAPAAPQPQAAHTSMHVPPVSPDMAAGSHFTVAARTNFIVAAGQPTGGQASAPAAAATAGGGSAPPGGQHTQAMVQQGGALPPPQQAAQPPPNPGPIGPGQPPDGGPAGEGGHWEGHLTCRFPEEKELVTYAKAVAFCSPEAQQAWQAAGLPEVRLPPHITAEHTVGISPEAWEQHLAPRWDGRVLQLLPEELPLPGKVTVRGNAQRKRAKLDFNSACKKLGEQDWALKAALVPEGGPAVDLLLFNKVAVLEPVLEALPEEVQEQLYAVQESDLADQEEAPVAIVLLPQDARPVAQWANAAAPVQAAPPAQAPPAPAAQPSQQQAVNNSGLSAAQPHINGGVHDAGGLVPGFVHAHLLSAAQAQPPQASAQEGCNGRGASKGSRWGLEATNPVAAGQTTPSLAELAPAVAALGIKQEAGASEGAADQQPGLRGSRTGLPQGAELRRQLQVGGLDDTRIGIGIDLPGMLSAPPAAMPDIDPAPRPMSAVRQALQPPVPAPPTYAPPPPAPVTELPPNDVRSDIPLPVPEPMDIPLDAPLNEPMQPPPALAEHNGAIGHDDMDISGPVLPEGAQPWSGGLADDAEYTEEAPSAGLHLPERIVSSSAEPERHVALGGDTGRHVSVGGDASRHVSAGGDSGRHMSSGQRVVSYKKQRRPSSQASAAGGQSNIPTIRPTLNGAAFGYLRNLYLHGELHRDALDDSSIDYLSKLPNQLQLGVLQEMTDASSFDSHSSSRLLVSLVKSRCKQYDIVIPRRHPAHSRY